MNKSLVRLQSSVLVQARSSQVFIFDILQDELYIADGDVGQLVSQLNTASANSSQFSSTAELEALLKQNSTVALTESERHECVVDALEYLHSINVIEYGA